MDTGADRTLWKATFDAIADAVFLVDGDGRIQDCNRAMERLCAASCDTLEGADAIEVLRGVVGAIDLPLPSTLAVGKRATAEAQRGDRYYRITLDPIAGPDGRVAGGVAIVAEVSEVRRLEEELWRRYVQLVDVDRRKDEFLAMLSHELRNPLAAIQAALDVERVDAGVATQPRLHAAIQRQVGHLTRLVADLLDVSRITRGKIELKQRHFDLRDVVRDAVAAVETRATARGHRLLVTLGEHPVPVFADPTRIEQVIANLVDNAAKYSEPGPIEITVQRVLDGTPSGVLSVRDYGIGIPAGALEEIFGLFVQLDPRIDRAAGGLGIGLTLVQRLVAMHAGTVEARSEGPGTGTELRVTLPLAEPAADAPARASVPAPTRETQPDFDRRVLLVEDNDDLREMVRWMLERYGFIVLEASSGPEAIDLAAREQPPVALLDIGLPGMDGFEVARHIRAFADPALPPIRLVAMTGYGSQEDRERALAAGFDAHLIKPVDCDELVRTISGARDTRENAPVT
jgi:PAS domain S-box-containing protein